METLDKTEIIINIVCAIDISKWNYNDYGNSRSFCETEFNGAKIQLHKIEKQDATCYSIINIDGIDFRGFDKGVKKFNEIVREAYAQKETEKFNEVTKIYNKLIQKVNENN